MWMRCALRDFSKAVRHPAASGTPPQWGVSVVVHGDDVTALGTYTALDQYERALQRSFDIKLRGRLGEGPTDLREIRVRNRILRVGPDGLRYEADPRHAEHVI